jgi:pimeloyl-ACP methyl ester carboxylesterase
MLNAPASSAGIGARAVLDRRLLIAGGLVLAAAPCIAQAKDNLMPTNSGYATRDGLRIYFEQAGGPLDSAVTPLVLLHGGLQTIEVAFGPDLLGRFARDRPVIAIEQEGHGHTGDRERPMTIDSMVQDTRAVLEHLNVRQADFFGFSLGAIISLGLAIRHPDLVGSVTTVSGSFRLEGMRPELVVMQRDPTHTPSPELAVILPTETDFAEMYASFVRHAPDKEGFERIAGKMNAMLGAWPGFPAGEVRSIRSPVLVVNGDDDFITVEHATELAGLIPASRLAILPGTTHLNILSRGDWIAGFMADGSRDDAS